MCDLYDDLENYDQENIIEELRNENKELKCKLEEYAATLDTLQKDFDKLSAEYKKLEFNYSSLLKTARAEIERKTTIITNLNVEKDKLVIGALQNKGGGNNHRNKPQNKTNKQQTQKQPAKGVDCDKGKNETTACNETDKTVPPVPGAVRNNRKDTDRINSLHTTHTSNTGLKAGSNSGERGLKPITSENDRDYNKTKSRESTQNDLHDGEERSKVQVKKIHNRRKSMPLFNRSDLKFSSDEEQENIWDRSDRDRFKRKPSSRDLYERKYDNDRTGRSGPKIYDTKREDDKYSSYHDSTRDYRKSYNHHNENHRHRPQDNRDKYDSSHRSRRQSPNRPHYNTRREYSNDRPHRSDTISHRVLESPPPDKYSQYRRSRDVDRNRFQNEESLKHKLHDVIEEPVCKRLRTESLNRQSDEHINLLSDRDIGIHTAGSQPPQYSHLYLQSPDYVHLENNPPVHQIREIMATAATALDDPRLKSKKYVVKTHKDIVTLSTVVGRDVDIKLVDETTWGKDKDKDKLQKMPTPLREKPQMMEDLVKDIYMDIDNPLLNLSMESGEIVCSEDDLRINNVNTNIPVASTGEVNIGMVNQIVANTNSANIGMANQSVANTGAAYSGVTNDYISNKGEVRTAVKTSDVANIDVAITSGDNKILATTAGVNTSVSIAGKYSITDVANKGAATTSASTLKAHVRSDKTLHNSIQSQLPIPDSTKQIPDPIGDLEKSPSHFKKFTIPKMNKPNTHKPLEDVITNIMHKLDKKDQCQKDKPDNETKVKEKSTQKEFDIHNPLKLFSSAKQISENKNKDQLVDVRRRKYSPEKEMSSARDTVEGDLELSDETSDCTEFTDQIRYAKEKNAITGECTNKSVIDLAHKESNNSEKQSSDKINKQNVDLKHGIENMLDYKHTNTPDTIPEMKLQESKAGNECLKQTNKTKDMKSKLCDLFGDSSSLITPDDLGIVEPPVTNHIINDYVPLFDNTQDAIDLNIEEMEKVQARCLKKELDKVIVTNEHQDMKHDKKQKNKSNKTSHEGKKKSKNNSDKKSIAEPVIKNDDVKVLNEEPNVVKTVIISTGVQNNCNSEDIVLDKGREDQSLDMLGKAGNNVPNCQSLTSLKALATSTPHKITQIEPTLPVPDISSNTNNVATKDIDTSSNTMNIDKTTQQSLDVPDVRIIIKRRRKGKATPS